MATTKTLSQLPAAGASASTDILHVSQSGVDAQLPLSQLAAWILDQSPEAGTVAQITGTTTISASPPKNQNILAVLASAGYTVTLPSITSSNIPMRLVIVYSGSAGYKLIISGLNNNGGALNLYNNGDCAVIEAIQTGAGTYGWQLVSSVVNDTISTSTSLTLSNNDAIRKIIFTTGSNALTLTFPAMSSLLGNRYNIEKADSGSGTVTITPNGSDTLSGLATIALAKQYASCEIVAAASGLGLVTAVHNVGWITALLANLGTNWATIFGTAAGFTSAGALWYSSSGAGGSDGNAGTAPAPKRAVSSLGTTGAIANGTNDSDYLVTAAITITLPLASSVQSGTRFTFFNGNVQTVTISANSNDYFGAYNGGVKGGSFYLYNTGDYVTVEYSTSLGCWFVVATNGPVITLTQSHANTAFSTTGAWTAWPASEFQQTIAPGVYDIDLDVSCVCVVSASLALGLGVSGSNPLSARAYTLDSNAANTTLPFHLSLRGVAVSASEMMQPLYYSSSGSNTTNYDATKDIGVMTIRRIA
jgi:hypothetical protein